MAACFIHRKSSQRTAGLSHLLHSTRSYNVISRCVCVCYCRFWSESIFTTGRVVAVAGVSRARFSNDSGSSFLCSFLGRLCWVLETSKSSMNRKESLLTRYFISSRPGSSQHTGLDNFLLAYNNIYIYGWIWLDIPPWDQHESYCWPTRHPSTWLRKRPSD